MSDSPEFSDESPTIPDLRLPPPSPELQAWDEVARSRARAVEYARTNRLTLAELIARGR